jgi:hypothetical protein
VVGKGGLLSGDPVAVAWWLRYNKKLDGRGRKVGNLMLLLRWNVQTLASPQSAFLSLNFHYRLTGENKKELLRFLVKVPGLTAAGRHTLLNHAKAAVIQQVPAIADLAPNIVFDSGTSDWIHDYP